MTVIENTLPFPPPPYDLNDNGLTFYPHEDQWRWVDDWPHVAEVWEKYWDEGEHREIMDFRSTVRCNKCYEGRQAAERQRRIEGALAEQPVTREELAGFPDRLARQHWEQNHRGEAISMTYMHPLWVYQLMGCEDIWYGKPRGYYNLMDPRDRRCQQWEYDALELGSHAADRLWDDR